MKSSTNNEGNKPKKSGYLLPGDSDEQDENHDDQDDAQDADQEDHDEDEDV